MAKTTKINTDCTCYLCIDGAAPGVSRENGLHHEPGCFRAYADLKPFEIARLIRRDWKKVYFGAVPYVEALAEIETWNSRYICETSGDVVIGFLTNASGWRGDVARGVKAVLNHRMNTRTA